MENQSKDLFRFFADFQLGFAFILHLVLQGALTCTYLLNMSFLDSVDYSDLRGDAPTKNANDDQNDDLTSSNGGSKSPKQDAERIFSDDLYCMFALHGIIPCVLIHPLLQLSASHISSELKTPTKQEKEGDLVCARSHKHTLFRQSACSKPWSVDAGLQILHV